MKSIKINRKKWISGAFVGYNGKACALGHAVLQLTGCSADKVRETFLQKQDPIIEKLIKSDIAVTNDRGSKLTPFKERILIKKFAKVGLKLSFYN